MSRIILGWQLSRPIDDVRVRALMEQIGHRYQPLFLERLQGVGLWQGNQGLLHIDVPRAGDAGLDRSDERICCLTGRPTTSGEDSRPQTAPLGAGALYDRLVTSTTAIQTDVVRRINPPFTLCWFDRRSGRLGVVHDGLGEDQFFVSHTEAGLVFSNRCWPILRLLGGPPRIDTAAWKYWFCMGWFPGTATPFENIRALDSGEIIVGDSRTVSSTASNALPCWIERRGELDTPTLMARAAEGVRDVVRQNQPATGEFGADLTGGIDSRAICSLLVNGRFRCRYYTGGSTLSPDVCPGEEDRQAIRPRLDSCRDSALCAAWRPAGRRGRAVSSNDALGRRPRRADTLPALSGRAFAYPPRPLPRRRIERDLQGALLPQPPEITP